MFPKKMIAALCAAVLALAMPTMAFANGVAPGGDMRSVTFQDKNGKTWGFGAAYIGDDGYVDIDVTPTNTTLAGLPRSEDELFYQTFDLTSSSYQEGEQVDVFIFADDPQYEGTAINFLVIHDDGTSERFSGYVGQNAGAGGYYFSMNKLCTVAVSTSDFASTGSSTSDSSSSTSQSGSASTGSSTSDSSSPTSQSGSAAGGTLSPKTGIDMDGQLFAIAACGIAAAGVSVVAIRRMARSK